MHCSGCSVGCAKALYTDAAPAGVHAGPAGTLTLGTYDIALPPGQAALSTTPNLCPATCTQRYPGPLNVISTFLHMWAAGTRAWCICLLLH